jgi:hypothetical protein
MCGFITGTGTKESYSMVFFFTGDIRVDFRAQIDLKNANIVGTGNLEK